MRKSLLAAALLLAATQAHAFAATRPDSGRWSVQIGAGDVSRSFDVGWRVAAGSAGDEGRTPVELSAVSTWTVDAFGKDWVELTVNLRNTTATPPNAGDNSNIVAFGAGVDGSQPLTPSFTTAGNTFTRIGSEKNFPGGFKDFDLCVFAANNCQGGNVNQGLARGGQDAFTLRLGGVIGSVVALSDFGLKFQTAWGSFEPAGTVSLTEASGPSQPVAVAEPASLGLLGVGMAALVWRRRRA